MSEAAVVPATPAPDIKPPEKPKKPYEEVDIKDVDTDAEKKLAFSKSFEFSYQSKEDGTRLSGRFTCKRPSLGEIGRLGVLKAQYNAGTRPDSQIDFLHEMFAYLAVTLTEWPQWWTPEDLYDINIIRAVYDHVRSWEESFRRRSVGK